MQLNEILEENSVKAIAKKTNISEENLEALFGGEFDLLKKVKAMGFISIVEREYGADLSSLRKQAQEFYISHADDESIILDAPVVERKKGRSKLLILFVLLLLGVASWYFITQFDQEKLRGFLPFNEEKMVEKITVEVDQNTDLSIEHAMTSDVGEERKESTENTVVETTSIIVDPVLSEENRSGK
jgi:cytoskeletal protein RodZ